TALVKDVKPGEPDSNPTNLTNVNGTLFFASRGYSGTYSELRKSDGTAAGTTIVKSCTPQRKGTSLPGNRNAGNGRMFVTGYDSTHGAELWKSDGTAAGTLMVKDVKPGWAGSYPRNLTNVNGTLFFVAGDTTSDSDLWKSDGTAAGTTLIKYVSPPPPGGSTLGSDPSNLTVVNGTLFFTAADGTTGSELWQSDGTAAGTTLVKDVNTNPVATGPYALTNVSGTLYFVVSHTNVNGTPSFDNSRDLWKS